MSAIFFLAVFACTTRLHPLNLSPASGLYLTARPKKKKMTGRARGRGRGRSRGGAPAEARRPGEPQRPPSSEQQQVGRGRGRASAAAAPPPPVVEKQPQQVAPRQQQVRQHAQYSASASARMSCVHVPPSPLYTIRYLPYGTGLEADHVRPFTLYIMA